MWGILQGGTSGHTQRAPQGHPLRTPSGPRQTITVSGVRARETFTEGCEAGLTRAARDLQNSWARVGG